MSRYTKRKKKTYKEGNPFIEKYRNAIIFALVLIIVAGAVAAVNAYEIKHAVELVGTDAGTGAENGATYYYADTASGTVQAGTAADAAAEGSEDQIQYPDFSQNEVSWNGKTYKRNTYIKPILVFGVDNQGSMHEAKEYGYAGQCDGVFLIAQDTAHNTVKLLMIPRDTMTEVMEMNPDTGVIEPYIDHLSLSYCFGDGMEKSCENSRLAVQTLLFNLPLSDYMAIDTSIIATLNDSVGGVTVTIPTEGMEKTDPAFVYGSTVTLKGSQAERFVRYRDITIDNSAINRMNQHRQYIEGFFTALKQTSRTDSNIVTKLYDEAQDYMVTNMSKDIYLKTALDVLQQGDINDSNMLSLPGYGTATDTFDEYYVNKDGVAEVILGMFYREA